MLNKISPRAIFGAMTLICIGLLATAYQLQYGPQHQQPCPYCILQRYAYMAIALVSLLAAIHGPQRIGVILYAAANALCSVVGLAFAGLQLGKSGLSESCLADPVGDFVNNLPSANWWPEYLFATGGCGSKFPPILGLSVPVWSLVWFSVFAILSMLFLAKALRYRPFGKYYKN